MSLEEGGLIAHPGQPEQGRAFPGNFNVVRLTPMDESAFENLSEQTLKGLEAAIEDQLDVDVEYRGGILTVELDDGRQYVINKHTPNRQIWLSSPVSGAAHFDYDQTSGRWKSSRGDAILHDLLAGELKAATGDDITFD